MLETVEASIVAAAVVVFVANIPEPHSRSLTRIARSREEGRYVDWQLDKAGNDVVGPGEQSRELPDVRTLVLPTANLMNAL